MKRMRGRNNRPPSGGGSGYRAPHSSSGGHQPMNRNHVFDSSGPDMRVRGTAQQLFEKYLQLGRDATGVGDRVMAESYFQHAEHYFRILNAMSQAQQQHPQQQHPQQQHPQQRRYQNGPEPMESYGEASEQPEVPVLANGRSHEPDEHDGGPIDPRDPD